MRLIAVAGLVLLAGCGGGGTTGTNYSDPPPVAEIVAPVNNSAAVIGAEPDAAAEIVNAE